jgi:hypothetical protein
MVSEAGIVRFRADRSSAARYSGGPARLTDPAELFADPAELFAVPAELFAGPAEFSSAGERLFFPLFFLVSIFQGGGFLELFLIIHCIKLSENIKNVYR